MPEVLAYSVPDSGVKRTASELKLSSERFQEVRSLHTVAVSHIWCENVMF